MRITNKLRKAISFTTDGDEVLRKLESTDLDIDYLGADDEYITYIPKSRLVRYSASKRWNPDKRQLVSPGKLYKTLFPEAFSNQYERFNNELKGNLQKVKIVFLSGEDIRTAYLEDNCAACGNLGASCMRYIQCQPYLDIYCKNTNHVQLAVVYNSSGKIIARSLIWYPKTIKDKSIKWFDRVYAIDFSTECAMIIELIKKGFTQISDKNDIKPNEDVSELEIHLDYLNFEYYPYIDTLCYINDNCLNNYEDGDCLNDTDGSRYSMENCDECGDESDDIVEIIAGVYRGYRYCCACRCFSNRYDGYISNREAELCTVTDDYILREDTVQLYEGSLCSNEAPNLISCYDGDYFIKGDDDFVIPIGSEEWYRIDSDYITCFDGNYYLISSEEYKNLIDEKELQTV